jgi:hypothetical protein
MNCDRAFCKSSGVCGPVCEDPEGSSLMAAPSCYRLYGVGQQVGQLLPE